MKEDNPILKNYGLFGVLFTFILGSVFHSVYELSNYSSVVGYFFPINESVWEHLKLAFYAWLIYGLANYFFLTSYSHNYWTGIWLASFIGNLFIVCFFYTYTGIIGYSIFALDIFSYLVSCLLGAYIFYKILNRPPLLPAVEGIGLALILLTGMLFALYTYTPPNLPLFEDFSQTYKIIFSTTPTSL